MEIKLKSSFRSQSGLVGGRLILILAIIGAFAAWAAYKGYFKWKGPKPAGVAQEMKSDISDSVDKLKK